MLGDVEKLVQTMAGSDVIVRHAHMELAEPTIAQGIASCIEAGAREVIVFPYMLSPGRHSTSDIPRMVSEVAMHHAGVRFSVTKPFGIDEKLGQVILARAGISADPNIPVTAT